GDTTGSVMAAASKSARILLLGPMLITFSLLRQTGAKNSSMKKSIVEALPGFLVGYVALAIVRAAGDRFFGDAAPWKSVIDANNLLLDVLMATVSAGIGLHLSIRAIIATSGRAVLVAGGTATLMAGLTLAMIAAWQRGSPVVGVAIGAVALGAA